MISRQWRGLARPEQASAYVEHLKTATFPSLFRLPGFKGASILRRNVASGVEFLIITEWESIETIRAFAGANVEGAVVPQNVRAMMIEYDRVVRHFEVVERQ
jgi:heme-degrading monooxygenase HmoA